MIDHLAVWEPDFYDASRLFSPIKDMANHFANWPTWPTLQEYNSLLSRACHFSNQTLQCMRQLSKQEQAQFQNQYEVLIYEQGLIQTRLNNWHDYLNYLVWLRFPLIKKSLNTQQYWAFLNQNQTRQRQRTRLQQCLAHIDETGIVVICRDQDLARLLIRHDWKTVFWYERQACLEAFDWIIVGHGLYDKLRHPFVGMTGKGILLFDPAHLIKQDNCYEYVDQLVARYIDGLTEKDANARLFAVPLLGIPGAYDDNNSLVFYENTDYFRPLREGSQDNIHLIRLGL